MDFEEAQSDLTPSEESLNDSTIRREGITRLLIEQWYDVRRGYRMFSKYSRLHKLLMLLPILSGLIPLFFILASFGISVGNGNLYEKDMPYGIIPYISDIGNLKPQSSVFTLGLTIGTFCSFGTIIVRYYQGKIMFISASHRINKVAYICGWLLVIGKLTICSFQLSSSSLVHYLGAFLYVIASVLYCALQTWLSYRNRQMHSRMLIYSRVLATSGMVLGAFIFAVFMIPALHRYNRGGLYVAQGGEWFFAALKMLFMITFFRDFFALNPSFSLISQKDDKCVDGVVQSDTNKSTKAFEVKYVWL